MRNRSVSANTGVSQLHHRTGQLRGAHLAVWYDRMACDESLTPISPRVCKFNVCLLVVTSLSKVL